MNSDVSYHIYENELNMPDIMRLIQKDLSEPYSIYTYRYFIHNWPNLCFMVSAHLIFLRGRTDTDEYIQVNLLRINLYKLHVITIIPCVGS